MSWCDKALNPYNGIPKMTKSRVRAMERVAAGLPAYDEKDLAKKDPVTGVWIVAPGRERKCTSMTSGNHGPKRPCDAPAILGGTVCQAHGGSSPNTKAAAKRRFQALVESTVTRLVEIRDQNTHMPSALGASGMILNRALGKVGDGPKGGDNTKPIIQIGIAFGKGSGGSQLTGVTLKQIDPPKAEHNPGDEDEFDEENDRDIELAEDGDVLEDDDAE